MPRSYLCIVIFLWAIIITLDTRDTTRAAWPLFAAITLGHTRRLWGANSKYHPLARTMLSWTPRYFDPRQKTLLTRQQTTDRNRWAALIIDERHSLPTATTEMIPLRASLAYAPYLYIAKGASQLLQALHQLGHVSRRPRRCCQLGSCGRHRRRRGHSGGSSGED